MHLRLLYNVSFVQSLKHPFTLCSNQACTVLAHSARLPGAVETGVYSLVDCNRETADTYAIRPQHPKFTSQKDTPGHTGTGKSAPIIDPRVPGPTKAVNKAYVKVKRKGKSRNADLLYTLCIVSMWRCARARNPVSPSTHARMNDVSTLARFTRTAAPVVCAVARARPRFFLPQNYSLPLI